MSESLPISPHKSAKNPHEHKGYHADFLFFEQTFSKSLVFSFFTAKGNSLLTTIHTSSGAYYVSKFVFINVAIFVLTEKAETSHHIPYK